MASPQISRRDFLALAGLTSASAGCPAMAQALKPKRRIKVTSDFYGLTFS